jgi:hypothetical protein
VTKGRLWIIGVTLLFVVSLFLPWFREVAGDDSTTTYNAYQAGGWWVPAMLAMVGGFAAVSWYGLSYDVRAMPFAALCGLGSGVLVVARCWTSLDPATDGGTVDRRWGLFVAINVIPMFGLAVREAARSLMRQMMPPVTERDQGYGI